MLFQKSVTLVLILTVSSVPLTKQSVPLARPSSLTTWMVVPVLTALLITILVRISVDPVHFKVLPSPT